MCNPINDEIDEPGLIIIVIQMFAYVARGATGGLK
jgi:hypothetical protein